MRRSGWALCLLALWLPWSAHADGAREAWGLRELMTALSQVRASRADFEEKKTLHVLNAPLVLRGSLSYAAPDTLEKHVRSPYDERYVVTGDALWVEKGGAGARRRFALPDYPKLAAFVESFRATLAGDLPVLEHYYRVRLRGDAARWSLELRPREADMLKRIRRIDIAGGGNRVTRIHVLETNGDASLMILREARP